MQVAFARDLGVKTTSLQGSKIAMKMLKIFEYHVLTAFCLKKTHNSTKEKWHWFETITFLLRQKLNIFKETFKGSYRS